jgi:hypothetical protein
MIDLGKLPSGTDEQLPLDWINPDGFFVYKILINQNYLHGFKDVCSWSI